MEMICRPYGRKISMTLGQVEFLKKIVLEYDIELFIELGVLEGGFGSYIYDDGMDVEYVGYDITLEYIPDELKKAVDYRQGDVFDPEVTEEIWTMMSKKTLLFCDNGDKPKESATYSFLMPSRSLLAVHDYGEEIFDYHLDIIKSFGFEPIEGSFGVGLPILEKI